jgi:SNF2 family DNA or RNA helicase
VDVNMKTYGSIEYKEQAWFITQAEPHICIKLKAIFKRIPQTGVTPFRFDDTLENANDLLWFMERYPLAISATDLDRMNSRKRNHIEAVNQAETILLPDYNPRVAKLNPGMKARQYQLQANDLFMLRKRLLVGDDLGLGKTLIGIIAALEPGMTPAAVVCQTHLPNQWKDQIEKFTNLKVHIIKGTKPYSLSKYNADVYITTYSRIAGWVDVFNTGFFKYVCFDEVQELRRDESQKYKAAKAISCAANYIMGLSATPIYNYGEEIFNVLECINPGCLGDKFDFMREWSGRDWKVIKDPKALGTYLRSQYLMIRRTREDVGRELPPVNRIVHTVEYDERASDSKKEMTKMLALKVLNGSFFERGQAARELDIMMRMYTGIGKAVGVANYVRMLLENGEPVILAGWHRDVYDIWLEQLKEYNPVLFTGSDLFIISLRSGIGLDGLQHRCKMVVIGELDWSPKVHEQLIARADRDGQKEQVTAIYLVCDEGSDPPIMNLLGLKNSQSQGIMNPLQAMQITHTDEGRIKLLAEEFLKRNMN